MNNYIKYEAANLIACYGKLVAIERCNQHAQEARETINKLKQWDSDQIDNLQNKIYFWEAVAAEIQSAPNP